MKKFALIFLVTCALSTATMASDIAFYIGGWGDGWYGPEQFDDVETIIAMTGNLFRDIQKFDDDALSDFSAWIAANTNDGEMDIIWLNGSMPSVLYAHANAQPDGSPMEVWLDNGNMVINVGDWFGYVSNEGGTRQPENGTAGAANILDLADGVIGWDGYDLPRTPTGDKYLPSLNDPAWTQRPLVVAQVVAPWEISAIFAADGGKDDPALVTFADPVIIHNTQTDGYVAIVNQAWGTWIADRGLTCAELIGNWGTEVLGLADISLAGDAKPKNGAVNVLRDVVLSWTPGEDAVKHDVYLGTVFEDVDSATRNDPKGVLVAQGQSTATFDPPGRLEFGQTYYWRVDEIGAAPGNTIYKGTTWSFTVEPLGYTIENVIVTTNTTSLPGQGIENIINGSGLNADGLHNNDTANMWTGSPNPTEPSYIQFEFDGVYKLHELVVWNYNMQFELFLGYGLKIVTLECSEDGANWTVLGDFELAQASGNVAYAANSNVPLGGVPAKFVRMTVVRSFSGGTAVYGLSEVRFLSIPVQATEPQPADGAVDVPLDTTLSWRPGREAASHDVKLGTDPDTLSVVGSSTTSSYNPGGLDLDATYSWQIVEVNNAETPSAWTSPLWTFTTQEYLVVEDFESYTDDWEAGEAIWQTWIDGWEDNTNGSQVGYGSSPFAEQTIVNNGRQSMPLSYNNGSASAISEADLTLAPAQNWTTGGIKTLSLWFHGKAGNTGHLYVKVNGVKAVYDGDAGDIGKTQWWAWNIDLAGIGANLSNVTTLTVGVEGAGSGLVFIDDIRLYAKMPEYIIPSAPGAANVVAHYALDGNANDSSGNGYNGTATGGFMYVPGVTGQALDVDGGGGYVNITNAANWPSGKAPRTMAAWLRTRSVDAGFRFAVAYGTAGTGRAMFLGINGTTLYGGGYGDDVLMNNFWVVDEWQHTCVTYDGTTARLYGNGIEVDAAAKNWDLQLSRAHIGQQVNDFSEFWNGAIDEVYIYNTALTPEEVAGLSGRTAPINVGF